MAEERGRKSEAGGEVEGGFKRGEINDWLAKRCKGRESRREVRTGRGRRNGTANGIKGK